MAGATLGKDPGPEDLVLEIDVGNREHVLYEPVVLSYTLRNPTGAAIKCQARLPFRLDSVKVEIEHDGKRVPFFTGPIVDGGGGEIVIGPRLGAGEAVVMFFNDKAQALAFPAIGHYGIYARVYLGDYPEPMVAAAPRVEIEVVGPREADEKVIDFLGSTEQLIALLRGGASVHCESRPRAACFEDLRLLLRQFPDSSYTPHIAFDLASAIEWGGLPVTPQYELAIDLLNGFLQKWPHHPLAAEVTAALVYNLDESGRKQEALDWLNRFERDYPTREAAAKAMRYRIQGPKTGTPPD